MDLTIFEVADVLEEGSEISYVREVCVHAMACDNPKACIPYPNIHYECDYDDIEGLLRYTGFSNLDSPVKEAVNFAGESYHHYDVWSLGSAAPGFYLLRSETQYFTDYWGEHDVQTCGEIKTATPEEIHHVQKLEREMERLSNARAVQMIEVALATEDKEKIWGILSTPIPVKNPFQDFQMTVENGEG